MSKPVEKEIDVEVIKTMLNKDPAKRNGRDIVALSNEIKNIAFLKKYQEEGYGDVHIQCARYMKYEMFSKGSAVFHIDTVGDKFFVTLKGRVGIYIRLPMSQKRKEELLAKGESDLTCVKELEGGFAFGELALINNKPRLASIICLEESHFMTLDKKSFVLVLKQKEEEKLTREMGFFAKLPFFEGWSYNLIKLIYLNSFRIKYSKGERVFSEGDEPSNIYIVTDGEFVTEKEFNKTKEEDEFGFRQTEQQNSLRKEGTKQKKMIQLSVLVRNEMFGEEDLLNKSPIRTYSAFCSTVAGECIVVKKRDFELRILHEEGARNYLEGRLLKKNQHMEQKLMKIRGSIADFQQYIYNDHDEIKTQKNISLALSKMEQPSQQRLSRRFNSISQILPSQSTSTSFSSQQLQQQQQQQQQLLQQQQEQSQSFFTSNPADDEPFSPTLLNKGSTSNSLLRQPLIRKQSGIQSSQTNIQSFQLIRGQSTILPPVQGVVSSSSTSAMTQSTTILMSQQQQQQQQQPIGTASPKLMEERRSSMMLLRGNSSIRQNGLGDSLGLDEILEPSLLNSPNKLARKTSLLCESPLLAPWKDFVIPASKPFSELFKLKPITSSNKDEQPQSPNEFGLNSSYSNPQNASQSSQSQNNNLMKPQFPMHNQSPKRILRLFQIPKSSVNEADEHDEHYLEEQENEESKSNSTVSINSISKHSTLQPTPKQSHRGSIDNSNQDYNFIGSNSNFDKNVSPIKKVNGTNSAVSSPQITLSSASNPYFQGNQIATTSAGVESGRGTTTSKSEVSISSPYQSFSELPLISEMIAEEELNSNQENQIQFKRAQKQPLSLSIKKGPNNEGTSSQQQLLSPVALSPPKQGSNKSSRHIISIENSIKYSETVLSSKAKSDDPPMQQLRSASRSISPIPSSSQQGGGPRIIVHPANQKQQQQQQQQQQLQLQEAPPQLKQSRSIYDDTTISNQQQQQQQQSQASSTHLESTNTHQTQQVKSPQQLYAQQMRSLLSIASDLQNSPMKITSKDERVFLKTAQSNTGNRTLHHHQHHQSAFLPSQSSSAIPSAVSSSTTSSNPKLMQHFFPSPPLPTNKMFLKAGQKTKDPQFSSSQVLPTQSSTSGQQEYHYLNSKQQRPFLNSSFSPMRGKIGETLSYKFEIFKNIMTSTGKPQPKIALQQVQSQQYLGNTTNNDLNMMMTASSIMFNEQSKPILQQSSQQSPKHSQPLKFNSNANSSNTTTNLSNFSATYVKLPPAINEKKLERNGQTNSNSPLKASNQLQLSQAQEVKDSRGIIIHQTQTTSKKPKFINRLRMMTNKQDGISDEIRPTIVMHKSQSQGEMIRYASAAAEGVNAVGTSALLISQNQNAQLYSNPVESAPMRHSVSKAQLQAIASSSTTSASATTTASASGMSSLIRSNLTEPKLQTINGSINTQNGQSYLIQKQPKQLNKVGSVSPEKRKNSGEQGFQYYSNIQKYPVQSQQILLPFASSTLIYLNQNTSMHDVASQDLSLDSSKVIKRIGSNNPTSCSAQLSSPTQSSQQSQQSSSSSGGIFKIHGKSRQPTSKTSTSVSNKKDHSNIQANLVSVAGTNIDSENTDGSISAVGFTSAQTSQSLPEKQYVNFSSQTNVVPFSTDRLAGVNFS